MLGWVVDVLVGWVVGSIVVGVPFSFAGEAAGGIGVLIGTALGIWAMRRRRSQKATAGG
jgi:hypothetical protein